MKNRIAVEREVDGVWKENKEKRERWINSERGREGYKGKK
jgi:hypothetical protein